VYLVIFQNRFESISATSGNSSPGWGEDGLFVFREVSSQIAGDAIEPLVTGVGVMPRCFCQGDWLAIGQDRSGFKKMGTSRAVPWIVAPEGIDSDQATDGRHGPHWGIDSQDQAVLCKLSVQVTQGDTWLDSDLLGLDVQVEHPPHEAGEVQDDARS
jgi:hypothetical protein